MDDLVTKIGSDSTLMFVGAITLVVGLFIVLVVVVSSMRVKTYKERFINVQIDNQEKEKLLSELQKSLQVLQVNDSKNKNELEKYIQIDEKLNGLKKVLAVSQSELHALEELQKQTQTKLENREKMYEDLRSEHATFQERLDLLNEENSRMRVNSARLLMKLETETRFTSEENQHHKEA